MAFGFIDNCLFVPTAGGTTDFVVSAAVQGYLTPTQASAVDGTTYRYKAQSSDLSQWEIGWGVWTAATSTLSRTTIEFSSNSNLKVSFTVAPNVGIVRSSADMFSMANSLSANQVLASPNGSSGVPSFRALVGSDLPNPAASSLGGIKSNAGSTSNWIHSINTDGTVTLTQPAFTDISGTLASGQLPATIDGGSF